MKILVTGSTGLVGRQVVNDLLISYPDVYSCYHDSKPELGILTQMDLTNPRTIIKTIAETKPDVIIHLAAITDVDRCETEKEIATKINEKATAILAQEAAKLGSFLVYVSTDYVFDGEKGMKKESDITHPVDFYGKSKLGGELAVKEIASRWCIARTSTPFGVHPRRKSFPLFVVENLQAKKEINAVTDQYTSSTYVPNLSKMLIEIATRKISGIIHVAGSTRISRYETAVMIAEKLGLDKKLIKPVNISDMNWVAKRPRDSSLDVSKAISLLNEKPLSFKQGLDRFIEEIRFNPN